MKEIFEHIIVNQDTSFDTVLCTIVNKSGSGPRDVGAQMLVGTQGLLFGTVGGGAVEQEAIQHAKDCLKNKRSDIHEYYLYINKAEDIGMICGGTVHIHFQYISYQNTAWKELCKKALNCIESHMPGNLLISKSNKEARFIPDTDSGIDNDSYYSVPLTYSNRAILFGAGHVSLALAPILSYVGFRVTVFDDRPDFANKERFPGAESILIGNYDAVFESLEIQKDDYIVVLTSGHSHDYEVEKQVLKEKVAYLGVIGSKKKTAAINEKLLADGFDKKVIDSVHTPIGLPILAVTPEEIAISIAAEMILVRAQNKSGSHPSSCPM